MKKILITLSICLFSLVSWSQVGEISGSDWKDRVFFGGNLGLQFGTITNIEVSPLMGYRVSEDFSAGLGLTYIYYKINFDNGEEFKTNIYGGRIFGRYNITDEFFAQTEFESLSLEIYDVVDARIEREWVPGFFIGGGYYQAISRNAGFSVMAMYNLIYDDVKSPYNSPIVLRIGFNVGF